MHSVVIVIILELAELSLQVGLVPNEGLVQGFAANGAYGAFDERMRDGHVGERALVGNIEDS